MILDFKTGAEEAEGVSVGSMVLSGTPDDDSDTDSGADSEFDSAGGVSELLKDNPAGDSAAQKMLDSTKNRIK